MAKKKVTKSNGELPDPLKSFQDIDDRVQIISEADTATAEWISTGSYALDAAISGSAAHGGVPSNKIVLFAGEPQTGKSFLACNICREAQKKGYTILYVDSEGSATAEFIERIGCDPNRFLVCPVQTIQETTHILLKLIDKLEKEEEEYGAHNKYMVVIDSFGNLSSMKERDDMLKIDPATGAIPRDMSKAQAVKGLFRCVTSKFCSLQVPMICISHTYKSMSMYTPDSISGGSGLEYNASVIVELAKSKLDDKITTKKAEESVNSGDITRTGILVTCKIRKSRFTIPRKVRMMISYFAPMRKEFGLEAYLTWDNAGIARGTIITEADLKKLSPADQQKVKTFDYKGQKCYALLKDTARSIVCAHKNVAVPLTEFLSPKIFDEEFMEYIDQNIIRPVFELPSSDKLRAMDDIVSALDVEDNTTE